MCHRGLLGFLVFISVAGSVAASELSPAPELPSSSRLLEKTALKISHNSFHKQADWVFYPLARPQLKNCVSRSGSFQADPSLATSESAQLSDYSGSGYDRGHLSPAGDNKWSIAPMQESFHLSNISPQTAGFNRGIWSMLEQLVRAWAIKDQGIWVTTGPILHTQLKTIGENHVSVPEYFYKAILTQNAEHRTAIALVLPNHASGDLSRYAVSVDRLEELSGLDFFKGLDPREEEMVESSLDLSKWDFKAKFRYVPCVNTELTHLLTLP